jgi:y4mF family transcriptional regulator
MEIHSTRDLAAAVRGRRTDLGLNQADLARKAGVSRKWLVDLEAGKATAEIGLVIRVLEQLGFSVDLSSGRSRPVSKHAVDLDALLEEHRAR